MTSKQKHRFSHLKNIHPTIKPGDTVRLVVPILGVPVGTEVKVQWTFQNAGGARDTGIRVTLPLPNGNTIDQTVAEGCIEEL